MKHSTLGAVLVGSIALLALAACPNPITDLTVSQISDRAGPVVSFSTPVEGSAYTQTVTVHGTAVDAGRLKSLAWTVAGPLGSLASGTIDPSALGADGAFSIQFSTLDWSGPIAVTVQATDWNDNVGQAVRTLASPGTALSSFTASPGNGAVTLSWEPVPGAVYTLYYTTNGSLPALGYGQQRTLGAPPYNLTGIANGAMHVFLLKATANGHDYWSGYVKAIPLSGITLAPSVRGVYGAVSVAWKSITGTDQFEVLRSTNRFSGFTNVSGTLTGTGFSDTGVLPGTRYYYQVRPALPGSLSSAPVAGESSPLPIDAERRVGYVIPPGNQLTDVAVFGAYAFAANYNSGFQIFDVSDPAHPVYVNGVNLNPDHAMGVGLNAAGTMAYVSAGTCVYAIDVSNPRLPQYVGKSVSVGAQTWGVTVLGSDVFVAASTAGGVKFANGNLASVAATFNTVGAGGGGAYGIASDANYVYIAAEAKVFIVTPVLFALAGSVGATRAMGVAVATHASTTYAYVADETASTLRIFDVTTPATPGTLGTLVLSGNSPRGVAVRWPTVALAGSITAGSAALQVVNVADPATPRLAFPVMLPTGAERVAISGDFAYAAMQGFGLQVANIANPATPTPQPTQPSLASAYTLALDGEIGVAGGLSNSMQVYNLFSPNAPGAMGPAYTPLASPYGVAVKWPYAYLAETNKLEIVDLSPVFLSQAPIRVGWTTIIGTGTDVALSGDYAVIADSGNCVDIVNVADPSNPVMVGNFLTTGYVSGVGVKGDYVYAVTGSVPATVYVISLANPLQPQAVGSLTLSAIGSQMNSLTVAGDFIYLSASNGGGTGYGMAIIDVSNPANPTLRNAASLVFDGRCVEVVGDHALVGPLSGSTLRVFSISNPASPRLIGTISQQAVGIRASGNHAFVVDYFGSKFASLSLWQ
jgi:hypothetical protein